MDGPRFFLGLCNLMKNPQVFEVDEGELSKRLHTHVDRLAGLIGPRHLGKPSTMEVAATYIEREFEGLGYSVTRQAYDRCRWW